MRLWTIIDTVLIIGGGFWMIIGAIGIIAFVFLTFNPRFAFEWEHAVELLIFVIVFAMGTSSFLSGFMPERYRIAAYVRRAF